MKLIVGIDFGTSTTVVRYKVEGTDTVNSVKDTNGISDTIPTVIFKCADGSNTVFGNDAISMSRTGMQGELISNFKMGLLDADEHTRKQKEAYIEEFLSFVYKRFAEETVKYTGYDMDVYISFPAKWSDGFVTFMKEAYRKAGFKGNIIGVNEPKAATYNMLFRHLEGLQQTKLLAPNKPINVFMLDMGAGTTDIVIFRLLVDSQGKIEIDNMLSYPTVDNPYLCGGREIDELLQKYVISAIKGKNVPFDEEGFTMDNAKTWKDQVVSTQLKKGMVLPLPPELMQIMKYMPNGKDVINSFTLSGGQFESATAEHWRNLYNLISSAIIKYKEKYGVDAEDIDMLFLTGGHSQWYTVPNLFNGVGVNGVIGVDHKTPQGEVKALNFKKLKAETWRMFGDARPHECVATGLCLQDSIPNMESKIESVSANNVWLQLVINDKCSDIVQVTLQGQTLPVYSDDFSVFLGRVPMKRDSEKPYVGQVRLYTGDTLANAKRDTFDIKIAFGSIKYIFTDNYIINIVSDISIGEDNTIGITGYVSFDPDSSWFSKEYVKFSNKTGDLRHSDNEKTYVSVIQEKCAPDQEKVARELMVIKKNISIEKAREMANDYLCVIADGVSKKKGIEIATRLRNAGAEISVKDINFS